MTDDEWLALSEEQQNIYQGQWWREVVFIHLQNGIGVAQPVTTTFKQFIAKLPSPSKDPGDTFISI